MDRAYHRDHVMVTQTDQSRSAQTPDGAPEAPKPERVVVNVFPFSVCEKTVKSLLKAPDTAEFPGLFDRAKPETDPTDPTVRTWRDTVKSKNLMGVTLRTNFTCAHKAGDDFVSVKIE